MKNVKSDLYKHSKLSQDYNACTGYEGLTTKGNGQVSQYRVGKSSVGTSQMLCQVFDSVPGGHYRTEISSKIC
jgi:hypothetical protein